MKEWSHVLRAIHFYGEKGKNLRNVESSCEIHLDNESSLSMQPHVSKIQEIEFRKGIQKSHLFFFISLYFLPLSPSIGRVEIISKRIK